MKTFRTLLIAIFVIGFASITQAQFRLGPVVAFGTDTNLGIGAKAKFDLNDQFKISPSVLYLGGESENTILGSVSSTIIELNGDVHYAFSDTEDISFYAIGGLNIGIVSFDAFGVSDSATEIGLNLGVGGEFLVANNFNAFAEAKFGLGGIDQLLISGGVYFSF